MQRTTPMPPDRARIEQRRARSTRIPLRRRLRFACRAVSGWIGRVLAAEGHADGQRRSFAQLLAREASEREAAIDASVGAMSPADIQRIVNRPG